MSLGASACTSCAVGSYQMFEGRTRCEVCPEFTNTTAKGAQSCKHASCFLKALSVCVFFLCLCVLRLEIACRRQGHERVPVHRRILPHRYWPYSSAQTMKPTCLCSVLATLGCWTSQPRAPARSLALTAGGADWLPLDPILAEAN